MLWPGGYGNRDHDQWTILEVDVMDKIHFDTTLIGPKYLIDDDVLVSN